jgi:hypothetical protein
MLRRPAVQCREVTARKKTCLGKGSDSPSVSSEACELTSRIQSLTTSTLVSEKSSFPALLKLLAVACIPALSGGCVSVADLSSREASICEVHKTPMKIEMVPGSPGYPGYVWDYVQEMEKNFPHNRGPRLLGGDYPMVRVKQAKVHVCPECDEAYRAYWKKRKG